MRKQQERNAQSESDLEAACVTQLLANGYPFFRIGVSFLKIAETCVAKAEIAELDCAQTFGAGHTGSSEMVNASDRTTRLTSGPAESPGIGTNAITPDTLASTSRKPYRVERLKVSSVCIPAKVTEQ